MDFSFSKTRKAAMGVHKVTKQLYAIADVWAALGEAQGGVILRSTQVILHPSLTKPLPSEQPAGP